MKYILIFFVFITIIIIYSCHSKDEASTEKVISEPNVQLNNIDSSKNDSINKPQSYQINGLLIGEPVEYNSGGMGSWFSVLSKGGIIVDTIDYSFGVNFIGNDSLVVRTVKYLEYDSLFKDIYAQPVYYTLITPDKKIILNEILPNFDNIFSSPNIIDSNFYYWGLIFSDTSEYIRLTAIRYDFQNEILDSVFLGETMNEGTDNWNYFDYPTKENGNIIFEHREEKWFINPNNFQLIN